MNLKGNMTVVEVPKQKVVPSTVQCDRVVKRLRCFYTFNRCSNSDAKNREEKNNDFHFARMDNCTRKLSLSATRLLYRYKF